MSDRIVRHLIALIGTAICAIAFYSGYVSGARGWWWVVFSVLIIYGALYKIVDVD
jgi:hypothetical protein